MRTWNLGAVALLTLFSLLPANAEAADSWPQWRGPEQKGAVSGDDFPVAWSESQGISWKAEVPGSGGSTPVIGGSTAYLTSGVDGKNTLFAYDLESGDIRWSVTVGEDRGKKHKKGSGSNPSVVFDGDSVFAYFRSGDLACVSTAGDIRWKTNLQDRWGGDELWWDLGNSPLLTKNALVLVVMQTPPSESYLVAFNRDSGDVLWRTPREFEVPANAPLKFPEEAAQSYTTPLSVTVNGQEAIAIMGADHFTLHDAGTGELLGDVDGFNPEFNAYNRSISSPVASGNIVVCPYSRGTTVTALNLEKVAADKGRDAVIWHRDDLGSDVPTPAVANGRVYIVNDKEPKHYVHCLDLQTGNTIWELKLPRYRYGYSSSPLVGGDHLYVVREEASTCVIGPLGDEQPEVVAVNELADAEMFTVASPVPVGDDLLIRTRNSLYRIDGSGANQKSRREK